MLNNTYDFFWKVFIPKFLGPGSIFIMLAGSFGAAFGVGNWESFVINLVPLILFILICLFGKPDTQIAFAQLLSIGKDNIERMNRH